TFVFVRRIILTWRVHRAAMACIGDEVSIFADKGAKFAYKGVYAYISGDYVKALDYLECALKFSYVSHNSSFCFEWIAQCYEALEKPAETLNYSIKAVDAEPSNVKSLFNLAELYANEGAFTKAEYYYNTILRYDADNATAPFMLGMLHMGRGRYDEAETQFMNAIAKAPDNEAVYGELAVLMAIKGDYVRMEEYYPKAVVETREDKSSRLKKRLNSIKRIQELCSDY
ncbi:MAG: tetratricopeptide repeat protein, partial [Oscillospiraceae bacterium]|nr:tetratricopeptide repeat protein [Oscillospiraceae bacterium]